VNSPTVVVTVEKAVIKKQEETLEWLTTKERCDSCGAQAYYVVSFASGSLFFCRHHYLKNEDVFFDEAEDIVDESELLITTR
jgi:hypothetical protein